MVVDKIEHVVGSFGPSVGSEPYLSRLPTEESPSGVLVRAGTYLVRSRVIDDDQEIYAGTAATTVRRTWDGADRLLRLAHRLPVGL